MKDLDTRKYKLWIRKANVFNEGTNIETRIVETNDIYHEIGYIYSTTLERIDRIDYQVIKEELKEELKEKLLLERNDLKDKSKKLFSFLNTAQFGTLTKRHQNLLYTQYSIMTAYIDVLDCRIEDITLGKGENKECQI